MPDPTITTQNPLIAEWTEKPWNPVTGCTKVSSGCVNCYAERITRWKQRLESNRAESKYKDGFSVRVHPETLMEPFSIKKASRFFTCSMSDLFHPEVPLDFIQAVFRTMNECSRHTYLVLTKRSDRLEEISSLLTWTTNIWAGVTVEEERYTGRIENLRSTGAFHKFICAEPLLGDLGILDLTGIDWIFVGGESGPHSRRMEESWVINLRDQCQEQHVTFTFKQWGGVKRKLHGSLLEGRYYHEMPDVMRD